MVGACSAISIVTVALAVQAAFLADARQLSDRDELVTNQQAVQSHVSTLLAHSRRQAAGDGPITRGIVYPAGGQKQLANAWVSMSILRHHHRCKLPIEMVYHGEREMPSIIQSILKVPFWPLLLGDALHCLP